MEVKSMSDKDIIKINTDIKLTDAQGNPIEVVTPSPVGINEIFSFHGSQSSVTNSEDN